MDVTAFSVASAVREREPGRFDADVHPEWTIGGKPNGGYLLATMARAATAVAPHPDVIAASAHYLHPPEPGPVSIEVEVLRPGRSASQLRARLAQDDRPCIEALLTVGTLDPDAQPYWDGGLPGRTSSAPADGLRLPPRTPGGVPVPIMGQVEVQIAPETLGWASRRPSGAGELRGWLALPGEDFDPVALLFAVDAFPPATFDIELSGWVPTLELTAYVRAQPAPGPVQVLQKAQLIDGQRVDESCFVWDGTGRLVAQSTQLAGIRLG
jgi:hypothetical protein